MKWLVFKDFPEQDGITAINMEAIDEILVYENQLRISCLDGDCYFEISDEPLEDNEAYLFLYRLLTHPGPLIDVKAQIEMSKQMLEKEAQDEGR